MKQRQDLSKHRTITTSGLSQALLANKRDQALMKLAISGHPGCPPCQKNCHPLYIIPSDPIPRWRTMRFASFCSFCNFRCEASRLQHGSLGKTMLLDGEVLLYPRKVVWSDARNEGRSPSSNPSKEIQLIHQLRSNLPQKTKKCSDRFNTKIDQKKATRKVHPLFQCPHLHPVSHASTQHLLSIPVTPGRQHHHFTALAQQLLVGAAAQALPRRR